eukprot:COSAG01_NODE_17788_length_1124_cov_1.239024_2_plen_114_part_00
MRQRKRPLSDDCLPAPARALDLVSQVIENFEARDPLLQAASSGTKPVVILCDEHEVSFVREAPGARTAPGPQSRAIYANDAFCATVGRGMEEATSLGLSRLLLHNGAPDDLAA